MILRALTIAAAAIALTGCSSLTSPGANGESVMVQALQHIEGCDRHYTGGTGVGAAFTFRIDCTARPPASTEAPAIVAP